MNEYFLTQQPCIRLQKMIDTILSLMLYSDCGTGQTAYV